LYANILKIAGFLSMAGLGPIGYAAGTPWILKKIYLFKALGSGEGELKGLYSKQEDGNLTGTRLNRHDRDGPRKQGLRG
jgi:hypothetical protein